MYILHVNLYGYFFLIPFWGVIVFYFIIKLCRQLFLHINNFSSVFNSSLWPWFWLQPVQQWFLVGGHKLTVTFSCIHCNTDVWSTIYVLTSQRFMWPDAFNLSSPVLGLGRIIIINIWYLLLFFDICGLVKQGYWLQRSPQTDV